MILVAAHICKLSIHEDVFELDCFLTLKFFYIAVLRGCSVRGDVTVALQPLSRCTALPDHLITAITALLHQQNADNRVRLRIYLCNDNVEQSLFIVGDCLLTAYYCYFQIFVISKIRQQIYNGIITTYRKET